MFISDEWMNTSLVNIKDGNSVEEVVLDTKFWKSIVKCLKGAFFTMQVFRMVDFDDKPVMSFIYKAMDKAKEKISLLVI